MAEDKKEKKEKVDKKEAKQKVAKQTTGATKRKLFSKSKGAEKDSARIADFCILRSPVVTEKSSFIAGNSSSGPGTSFVLRVDTRATKFDIRQAIERIYKVDVVKVNTVNYMGKVKRAKRSQGRQDKFKKAYITIKEGQSINIVEGL